MYCNKCKNNSKYDEIYFFIKKNGKITKLSKEKFDFSKSNDLQNKKINKLIICSECKQAISLFYISNNNIPEPYEKMDNDFKILYNEAKNIVNQSPRGSLGLLRCIFENILYRKFNIQFGTKLMDILKRPQIIKALGSNIIDEANNFKNICNSALHSTTINIDLVIENLPIFFDWINKISWVINDSNKINNIEIKKWNQNNSGIENLEKHKISHNQNVSNNQKSNIVKNDNKFKRYKNKRKFNNNSNKEKITNPK